MSKVANVPAHMVVEIPPTTYFVDHRSQRAPTRSTYFWSGRSCRGPTPPPEEDCTAIKSSTSSDSGRSRPWQNAGPPAATSPLPSPVPRFARTGWSSIDSDARLVGGAVVTTFTMRDLAIPSAKPGGNRPSSPSYAPGT